LFGGRTDVSAYLSSCGAIRNRLNSKQNKFDKRNRVKSAVEIELSLVDGRPHHTTEIYPALPILVNERPTGDHSTLSVGPYYVWSCLDFSEQPLQKSLSQDQGVKAIRSGRGYQLATIICFLSSVHLLLTQTDFFTIQPL